MQNSGVDEVLGDLTLPMEEGMLAVPAGLEPATLRLTAAPHALPTDLRNPNSYRLSRVEAYI